MPPTFPRDTQLPPVGGLVEQVANSSSLMTGPRAKARNEHRPSPPPALIAAGVRICLRKVVPAPPPHPDTLAPSPCGPELQTALRNSRLSSPLPDSHSFENGFKASKRILPSCLGDGRSDLFGPEGVQAEVRSASPLKDILNWGVCGGGSSPASSPVGPRCAMITTQEAQDSRVCVARLRSHADLVNQIAALAWPRLHPPAPGPEKDPRPGCQPEPAPSGVIVL